MSIRLGATATVAVLLCLAGPVQSAPQDLHQKLQKLWRDRLVTALAAGESVELTRLGQQMGVGRILAALRSSADRPFRRAALAAAPATPRAWTLLATLLALMQGADRDEAVAAARAARHIAEGLRRRQLARHEEGEATLRPLLSRALALSLDQRRHPDVRVLALLTAAALTDHAPLSAEAVARLLQQPDARLRRTAVELAAASPLAHREALLGRLGDKKASVRRAAAAALCAVLPARGRVHKHPLIMALRAGGHGGALVAVAADQGATRDELLDVGRCLRALGDATSGRAYRALRRRVKLRKRR